MATAVLAAFVEIDSLPDRRALAPATVAIAYRPVALTSAGGPLRLVGAWRMRAGDSRLGGLSALAINAGRLLAVTDQGAVIRFDFPAAARPVASFSDLREGPGPFGEKRARDAESLIRQPHGRGWWIGYEQRHSLWLYDGRFMRAEAKIALPRLGWRNNRGAEALIVRDGLLIVLAENGRHAVRVGPKGAQLLKLHAGADVADAAIAPDGTAWLLLRDKAIGGIRQSVVPLRKTHDGYIAGPAWPLPKGPFDNYEGMAIEPLPSGRWRFWLVTDDGHRIMARTLLVALDLILPARARHDKSPANTAGLSKKPAVEVP